MSDLPPKEIPPEVPQAVSRPANRRRLPQIVWVIPVLTLLVGGYLGLKALLDKGPTITIRFTTADGLEENKTRIKFKDVDIGLVRRIALSDDRTGVLVKAELSKQVSKGFLVKDTRFWVVRPRIAGGQISGLGTLLSGSYIGADPGKSSEEQRDFLGLETPVVVTSGLAGRTFLLRGDDLGSLDIGSPVYFRRVQAGQVVTAKTAKDGKSVEVGVFVNAPFDQFVTTEARFWNASGIDVTLDASGVKLQTQSLATVILGGIAFEAPAEIDPGPRANGNTEFRLWNDRAEAMKRQERIVEKYLMVFDQSVRGLQAGAPIDFRGIVVGEVKSINLQYDPKTVRFKSMVEVLVFPERLRSFYPSTEQRDLVGLTRELRIARFIERGFRGQLRSANLLTGQQYVAVDFFPKAPKVKVDTSKSPPEIPTIPGSIEELQESVASIVRKLEKVPFDQIGQDVRRAIANLEVSLKNVDGVMKRVDKEVAPELQKTLEQARRTLTNAERAIADDGPLQQDLRETLRDVSKASDSLKQLTDYLEQHPESLIRGKREEKK